MGKTTRNPAPAVASLQRFKGVPIKAIALLREVERALAVNNVAVAERSLALAMVVAPQHPLTLRLLGRCQFQRGLWAEAVQSFGAALAIIPGDVDTLIEIGKAQSANGAYAASVSSLREAATARPTVETLIELGIVLDAGADAQGALDVADRILAMEPTRARARLLRARCLQALGAIDATAAEYRELIRRRQEVASAWFALMDIKTIRLGEDEHAALRRDYQRGDANEVEQSLLGFAWGRACEDAADYPSAVEAFDRANHLARRRLAWNAAQWSREVEAISAAFKQVDQSAPAELGREVIFIVGMPRSGTTLIEHILAAHPQVEGANELPDMAAVIGGETRRRRKPFAEWSVQASAHDWERLGREYLDRTACWRSAKPIHTDKMPENWIYAGAIRAMLPAARIIDARRDPVETGWSCFKQLFAPNRVAWSYSYEELAAYWRDYDRSMRELAPAHPGHLRCQSHETLVREMETEVRALLAFCDLPWDAACLQPHRSDRAVRTASSAQVRRPVSQAATRRSVYGSSLDPFRRAMLAVAQTGQSASDNPADQTVPISRQ